jgi:hypothetical protein
MKLILKIAAGIIVAWVLILGTALIIGLLTAKALTETVVEPQVNQFIKPLEEQLTQAIPLTPVPVPTPTPTTTTKPERTVYNVPKEELVWKDVTSLECIKLKGYYTYEPNSKPMKLRCGVLK